MQIVVNHLTRMRGGYVCAAGVDVQTSRHVRPVLPEGQLPPDFLARNGGPFDIANLVDLLTCRPTPKPPHVEDHVFTPSRARLVETFGAEAFWALLCSVAKRRLRGVFGSDLKRAGRSSAGTEDGKGTASLGCFLPRGKPRLLLRGEGQFGPSIHVRINDGEFDAWVGVTDVRLYQDDHITPNRTVVEETARRLQGAGAVILGVGLTRAYAPSAEAQPMHWLQVNNIHLEDEVVWQLG